MSSAPSATTPVLATAGSPAVTGADRPSRAAEGNGAAVDFWGGVTKSEGVVWGQVLALLGEDTTRRRRADTDEDAAPSFARGRPGRPRQPVDAAAVQRLEAGRRDRDRHTPARRASCSNV